MSRLLRDEAFVRKALPNIRPEYFQIGSPERVAFELIRDYVKTYDALPTPEALVIDLGNRSDLNQKLFDATGDLFSECLSDDSEPPQAQWMLDQTEEFCQDKAIYNAISKSLEILRNKGEKGLSKGSIPKLLQDALAVTFDPRIGHDWLDDAESRHEEYTAKRRRLEFDLKYMNLITRGGLLPKTLNVVMAVSGAGKSLFMCHCAAAHYAMGRNVLYITLELSEAMVGQRIDANLLGIDMDMLGSLPRDVYMKKIGDVRARTPGRLIIKEYAVGTAGAGHFRHLLSELRTKKSFVPDIIYVDYINICSPTGRSGEMNSYERVKTVAEELRAIAVDWDLPVFSATQTNRGGYNSSVAGMENASDSIGLPMTADLFFALIQTEELMRLNQYKVSQLKSRYDDIGRKPYFFLGVEKSKMRLTDVENDEEPASDETQVPRPVMVGKPGLSFSGFR